MKRLIIDLCVHQWEMPHTDDPHITKDMYNLAIGLIQSFDEMEGKESRWGQRIIVHLIPISDYGIDHQRAVIFPLLCAHYMPNEKQFNPETVYFNSDTCLIIANILA